MGPLGTPLQYLACPNGQFWEISPQRPKGGAGQRGYRFWSHTSDSRCPTTYERSGDSVCVPKCPETIPYHAYTYYGTSVKILKRLELSAGNYRTFTKGVDTQFWVRITRLAAKKKKCFQMLKISKFRKSQIGICERASWSKMLFMV